MTLDINEFLRHDLYIERLATGSINKYITPGLTQLEKDIAAIFKEVGELTTQKELNAVTRAINEAVKSNTMWQSITSAMEDMAVYEAGWQAAFIGKAFAETMNLPTDSKIVSYVTRAMMSLESSSRVDSGTWAQYVKNNNDNMAQTANSIARDGLAHGRTVREMTTKLRNTFKGVTKNNAETLARTGYAHYAARANELMIEDNTDVLQEYYYVVTFDNRTNSVCINLDVRYNPPSKRFKVGDKKAPIPPLHYRCRTRRLGVPKGWKPSGERTVVDSRKGEEAEKSFERRKEIRDGKTVKYRGKNDKAFKGGREKASTSYETWLKTQEPWFIKDTLGAQKGQWFIDGTYSLKSFTDMTGRPLTLEQIKERG